jgi:hypothetical protein
MWSRSLVLTAALPALTAPAYAASLFCTGTLEFAEVDGALAAGLAPGDTFSFSFALDDGFTNSGFDAVDRNVFYDQPYGLVLARAGGTGSWNPVSGVFGVNTLTTVGNAGLDSFITSHNTPGGFAEISGGVLTDFYFIWQNVPGEGVITPQPANATLFQVLGNAVFSPAAFEDSTVELVFTTGMARGTVTSISVIPVPVPGAAGLAALPLLAVCLARRR